MKLTSIFVVVITCTVLLGCFDTTSSELKKLIGENAIVTTLQTNVRSSPEFSNGNVVKTLKQFSLFKIYDIKEKKRDIWFKINTNSEWVSENTSAVIFPSQDTLYGLLSVKRLNVREGPNKSRKKIGILKSGDLVEVISILDNGWILIQNNEISGFVYGEYINIFNVGEI